MLPEEIRPVLDNGVPCVLATCSADGAPNTTIISQAYYVDPEHVALSFQFFSKTIRNVRENPNACLCLSDIVGRRIWLLQLEYDHSETAGPIFDEMDMQIEAIASTSGMQGIFKLRAADIYRVTSVRRSEARRRAVPMDPASDATIVERLKRELAQKTEEVRVLRQVSSRINTTLHLEQIYEIVLHTMHDLFGFSHSLILLLDDTQDALRVVAGRGYEPPPVGIRVPVGVGVIGTVAQRKKMMRVGNLGQQRSYAAAIREQVERSGQAPACGTVPALPGLPDAESQVAIPLLIEERLVGVFAVESVERRVFDERDETLIAIVANLSASAIHNALLYRREEQRRESLEETVEVRTRQLERTSDELTRVQELRAKEAQRREFTDIIGSSRAVAEARELLRKVARSPASTILITGENGTGKDLAARIIHDQSDRAPGPFMNITCSALAENLLESELFGHERGAFTDAHRQKKGLLELADGGSVFLDEIGEMSLTLQSKLLRFLEEKAFKRVGGSQDLRVDVRVIAATNRDLEQMVERGAFREDLYYRLRVLPVELPPLRERQGDVPHLVRHFLLQFQREFNKNVRDVDAEAIAELETYDWPGNVRELRNAVERAVLLAEGPVLRGTDFRGRSARPQRQDPSRLPPAGLSFERLERSLVTQALERTGWNKAKAAKLLGMPRDWLRYRIAKFNLEPPRD